MDSSPVSSIQHKGPRFGASTVSWGEIFATPKKTRKRNYRYNLCACGERKQVVSKRCRNCSNGPSVIDTPLLQPCFTYNQNPKLTILQRHIWVLLACGYSRKMISQRLDRSPKTIEYHIILGIRPKLGVFSDSELIISYWHQFHLTANPTR